MNRHAETMAASGPNNLGRPLNEKKDSRPRQRDKKPLSRQLTDHGSNLIELTLLAVIATVVFWKLVVG